MKVPVKSELFTRNRAVEITTGSGAVREVIPGSVRQRTNLRIPHPWFTNWRLENAADHNAVGRYVIVVPFASIIRQEVVDHGLNAAMTAWHLTDWTWKEIKDSPRLRSLATRAGTPIRELKQFQEFVKRDLHRVGVLRRGRRLNETFRLLEGPSVFHQGNRAIQNKSAPRLATMAAPSCMSSRRSVRALATVQST